jgi:hypothetical protein
MRYQAGFEILAVVTTKRFGGTCYSIFKVEEGCLFYLEEGGKKFLRNANITVTSHPRRQ